MIKRDSRNIGKTVKVIYPGHPFEGMLGTVRGFRGTYKDDIPYVQVALYSEGLYTVRGDKLVILEE